MRAKQRQVGAGAKAMLATLLIALGVMALAGYEGASAGGDRWYKVTLEAGEVDGYQWAFGAKGPKGVPLGRICALTYMVEPAEPDAPYVEGSESVNCGALRSPLESVSGSSAFGSGESRVAIFTGLYRLAVRKVVFVLSRGERRVFLPRIAKVADRRARGIPRFRYFVAPFTGKTCIRRVTLLDGEGAVINSERRSPCHSGGNS